MDIRQAPLLHTDCTHITDFKRGEGICLSLRHPIAVTHPAGQPSSVGKDYDSLPHSLRCCCWCVVCVMTAVVHWKWRFFFELGTKSIRRISLVYENRA